MAAKTVKPMNKSDLTRFIRECIKSTEGDDGFLAAQVRVRMKSINYENLYMYIDDLNFLGVLRYCEDHPVSLWQTNKIRELRKWILKNRWS